jgi:hypothetical protein
LEETKKEGTESRSPDDFSIKIYDHLMRDSNNQSAAIYFYSSFLKCKIAETAAIQTKKFYETTIGFINDSDLPQEEKVRLRGDVISSFRDNGICERNLAQNIS